MSNSQLRSVTLSFVDGDAAVNPTSVEILPDVTTSLRGLVEAGFRSAGTVHADLPPHLGPYPFMVAKPVDGGLIRIVPMLDVVGVNEVGNAYVVDLDADLPWIDFERGLELRDPAVETRHLAFSNVGGFGGGGDPLAIASLFQDLFGSTPRWRRSVEPWRRLMGDKSVRWPSAKVVAQAQDFVHRGLPTKEAVANFTRISQRWDPVRYGELLRLTEREAEMPLDAVGYVPSNFGLWVDPYSESGAALEQSLGDN